MLRVSALALAAALTACAGPGPAALAPTPAATAPSLPPLTLPLQDGTPWTSTAPRAELLVVDVWASYCKPCAKAFPHLTAIDARADVAVVGISVDEDDAAVAAFLAAVPAGFAIARDRDLTVQDPPLAVTSLPTVLVVDRAGRIRWRKAETTEADYRALPALLDALAAEPAR
jgi:thiol-disulfide isomerase/thioredoxin